MGQSNPNAPDPAESYRKGIEIYLQHLPQLLGAEADARALYDPQRIAQQQGLQEAFGPTQYAQQRAALEQLDPQGTAIRGQLASHVQGDLASGYNLPEDYSRELTSEFRGAQAARGNNLGDSAAGAESAYKGKAALDLYYKRLGAAGTFLGTTGPVQQIPMIQSVQPDRTSAYVNPSSGYAGQNFALQNYQNQLAQANQQNPWAGALTGAAQGASAGSSAGGWGALIGGIAGGAAGYFSDRRLKCDIQEAGEMNGFKLYDFRFISDPLRRLCRGVMADEVQRIRPDAVSEENAYLLVDYAKIGIPFVEVG